MCLYNYLYVCICTCNPFSKSNRQNVIYLLYNFLKDGLAIIYLLPIKCFLAGLMLTVV